jgi:hypothetical protein
MATASTMPMPTTVLTTTWPRLGGEHELGTAASPSLEDAERLVLDVARAKATEVRRLLLLEEERDQQDPKQQHQPRRKPSFASAQSGPAAAAATNGPVSSAASSGDWRKPFGGYEYLLAGDQVRLTLRVPLSHSCCCCRRRITVVHVRCDPLGPRFTVFATCGHCAARFSLRRTWHMAP